MARAARQTLGAGSACLFGLQILLSRGPTCRHSCSEADAHTRALSLPCFRGHDCEFESWTEWSAYLSPEKNQTRSLNMLQCLPGRVSMGTTRGFEPERPWPRFAVSGKRIKEIARLLFLLPVAELLATGFELSLRTEQTCQLAIALQQPPTCEGHCMKRKLGTKRRSWTKSASSFV